MSFLTKYIHKINFHIEQKRINKDFKKNGLTEDNLKRQVKLNIRRHELNIPDGSDKVYEEYVQ